MSTHKSCNYVDIGPSVQPLRDDQAHLAVDRLLRDFRRPAPWNETARQFALEKLREIRLENEGKRYFVAELQGIFRKNSISKHGGGLYRWWIRRLLPGSILFLIVACSYQYEPENRSFVDALELSAWWSFAIAILLSPFSLLGAYTERLRRKRLKSLVTIIGDYADTTYLGPLAEAATDTALRQEAFEALTYVLRSSRPDPNLLNDSRIVGNLCSIVLKSEYELATLIIDTLSQSDHRQAFTMISGLARIRSRPAISHCAKTALEIMLKRREANLAPSLLLRPDSAPDGKSNEYLRAAVDSHSAERDLLLKAAAVNAPLTEEVLRTTL